MARRILWASLALAPIAFIAHYGFHVGATASFLLSAAALIPLAWLIGEATENAAQHTGPGIGGFLNASFGNAPELIIVLLAIADGLPGVVRGTITGSVVSNILLVLGIAMIAGGEGKVNARSLRLQLSGVAIAVVLLLIAVHSRLARLAGPVVARHCRHPGRGHTARRLSVDHGEEPAHPPRGRPRRTRCSCVVPTRVARHARRGDAGDGVRLGDSRPFAAGIRQSGRPARVLHRGRDRRDRRERGGAWWSDRDREAWQHRPRDRDRDHVLDAGGAVRRAGGRDRLALAAPPPVALIPPGRDRDDGTRLGPGVPRHEGRHVEALGGVLARRRLRGRRGRAMPSPRP